MRVQATVALLMSVCALAGGGNAAAQVPAHATPTPPPKPPISAAAKEQTAEQAKALTREKTVAAKLLFGAKHMPAEGKSMSIGYYPRGCLSGGVELPVTGATWQVMRLSRNRNWGHPSLIHFLEKFAPRAAKATGWKGILIGDMAQPRGGPAVSDHMSHQTGLDVDIWFKPMPDRILSKEERDAMPAQSLVASDWKHLNPQTWTSDYIAFIKTAAEQPEVERVLVNAVIKKELCRVESKEQHAWMSKVRPWYGHQDHIHVRLRCPTDSPQCRAQPAVPAGDGCSDKDLAFWFTDKALAPQINPIHKPGKPIMLADLPAACKAVLEAPDKKTSIATENR